MINELEWAILEEREFRNNENAEKCLTTF